MLLLSVAWISNIHTSGLIKARDYGPCYVVVFLRANEHACYPLCSDVLQLKNHYLVAL